MAELAFAENTGARGLVSVIEKALLDFERVLPSSASEKFPVTLESWPTLRICCNACWRRPRTRTGTALLNG